MSDLLDRYRGSLLGLAVGDAIGADPETWRHSEAEHRPDSGSAATGGFRWRGETTDATDMMLCIARSIIEQRRFDPGDAARRLADWLRSSSKDTGRACQVALGLIRDGVPWHQAGQKAHEALGRSAGNGSLQRCAPVALLDWRNEERLIKDSINSSLITHFDDRACWGAAALNLAIAYCLTGAKEGILAAASRPVAEVQVRRAVAEVGELSAGQIPTSPYVLDTLQAALWCFLNAENFEKALATVMDLGGDTSTIGAVCGAMAGACYGLKAIPDRWASAIELRAEIIEVATGIYDLGA
jgi:ADP-ribosyl-[dinitrogen reductase] hydrolase